jgi:hypothetical protein
MSRGGEEKEKRKTRKTRRIGNKEREEGGKRERSVEKY